MVFDLIEESPIPTNSGAHNGIFRGKFLGNSVTDNQYEQISNGTFKDLYIGDYWTINNITYYIAAFDYYLNTGDTVCTEHHCVLVPATCLYSYAMNTTATTAGGYASSNMFTNGLNSAKTTINSAFSGHVLSKRTILSTAVNNGKPSNFGWYSTTVDLMNEQMVYGSGIFSPVSDGSTIPANYLVEKSQLPLFQHEPSRICNRASWWLRDVISASYFALVDYRGYANYYGASNSLGVRPAFCIYGG